MISYILDLWKIHFREVFTEPLLYCKHGLKPLCVELNHSGKFLFVEELDNPGQNIKQTWSNVCIHLELSLCRSDDQKSYIHSS